MAYADRFIPTDNLVAHLTPYLLTVHDAAILSSYAGFLSVSAITVYELAIKDIFNDFATKKHSVFGHFIEKHLSQINGRIKISDLRGNQVKSFGDKYLRKFDTSLDAKEADALRRLRASIKTSYDNLLVCRHRFVHGGNATMTHTEVIDSYNLGKEVIHSLHDSMRR